MHRSTPLVLLFFLAFSSADLYDATEASVAEVVDVAADVALQDWFAAPPLLPVSIASSEHIRSPRCRNQSQLFLQELRNFTLWAVQSK
jgi:hypothetical protein